MDIEVYAGAPGRGMLQWPRGRFACSLGRAGVTDDKREGDGCTPLGTFPLRRLLWRADRLAAPPPGRLPAEAIAADDGWCDAPGDPLYNRPVKLPYPASAEAMRRNDALYDIVAILGHNDAPVVPGAGSAIFLHVAPADGGPTAGCVALPLDALLTLLADCGPDTRLTVRR